MKTVRMLLALMVIALVSVGLSGCGQDKKAATVPAPAEEQVEAAAPAAAAPAAEHPESDKPKDHPDH